MNARSCLLTMICGLLAGTIECDTIAAQTTTAVPMELSDSTSTPHCQQEQFKIQQLIVPTSLLAVGTFGVYNGWFHGLRDDVRTGMTDLRKDYIHIDDYIQYLPVASNIGLGLIGVKGKHPMREKIATTATAYAIMGILTYGMKHSLHETRPDTEERNSFPSGHAARAFMGAELVRMEYGWGYGLAAYSIAAGTAFLRLYNDRHWLNDVIGGAGIGILSAQAAYWLLPLERKLLGWKSPSSSFTLVPFTDGHSANVSLSWHF